jgi:hypothetical protein
MSKGLIEIVMIMLMLKMQKKKLEELYKMRKDNVKRVALGKRDVC